MNTSDLFNPVSKGKIYVIVIGCGRLGASIASTVYEQGHDVCMLDKDPDSFRRLDVSYGGLTRAGDALDLDALSDISAPQADCIILATDNDNVNLMVSQMAEAFFHTPRIICRLYDPEKEVICKSDGITPICPALLSAREIEKLLTKEGKSA